MFVTSYKQVISFIVVFPCQKPTVFSKIVQTFVRNVYCRNCNVLKVDYLFTIILFGLSIRYLSVYTSLMCTWYEPGKRNRYIYMTNSFTVAYNVSAIYRKTITLYLTDRRCWVVEHFQVSNYVMKVKWSILTFKLWRMKQQTHDSFQERRVFEGQSGSLVRNMFCAFITDWFCCAAVCTAEITSRSITIITKPEFFLMKLRKRKHRIKYMFKCNN